MPPHLRGKLTHDLPLAFHEALRVRGGDVECDIVAAHLGVFGQYGFTLLQNGGELVGQRQRPVQRDQAA